MASLYFEDKQAPVDQLREMRARRLRRNIRGVRELAGGAGRAVDEAPQHARACGVGKQTRDARDAWRFMHISSPGETSTLRPSHNHVHTPAVADSRKPV